MPVPLFDNFFFKWIYPAALTAFGVGANAYILRGKMKEVKGDLKEVTSEAKELQSEAKEMESEVKEMDSEVKEMADETRALARLRAALELHDKAMAETFFQDCVKGKSKYAEVDD